MHLVMMIVDIRPIHFNRGIILMMVLNVLKSLTKDVRQQDSTFMFLLHKLVVL